MKWNIISRSSEIGHLRFRLLLYGDNTLTETPIQIDKSVRQLVEEVFGLIMAVVGT